MRPAFVLEAHEAQMRIGNELVFVTEIKDFLTKIVVKMAEKETEMTAK